MDACLPAGRDDRQIDDRRIDDRRIDDRLFFRTFVLTLEAGIQSPVSVAVAVSVSVAVSGFRFQVFSFVGRITIGVF
jgi:hypothetical protein